MNVTAAFQLFSSITLPLIFGLLIRYTIVGTISLVMHAHVTMNGGQIVRAYQEKSADERERDLWVASGLFMRGELTMEELEEIEHPYNQDVKEACLALAEPEEPIQSSQSFLGRLFGR